MAANISRVKFSLGKYFFLHKVCIPSMSRMGLYIVYIFCNQKPSRIHDRTEKEKRNIRWIGGLSISNAMNVLSYPSTHFNHQRDSHYWDYLITIADAVKWCISSSYAWRPTSSIFMVKRWTEPCYQKQDGSVAIVVIMVADISSV